MAFQFSNPILVDFSSEHEKHRSSSNSLKTENEQKRIIHPTSQNLIGSNKRASSIGGIRCRTQREGKRSFVNEQKKFLHRTAGASSPSRGRTRTKNFVNEQNIFNGVRKQGEHFVSLAWSRLWKLELHGYGYSCRKTCNIWFRVFLCIEQCGGTR